MEVKQAFPKVTPYSDFLESSDSPQVLRIGISGLTQPFGFGEGVVAAPLAQFSHDAAASRLLTVVGEPFRKIFGNRVAGARLERIATFQPEGRIFSQNIA